MPTELQMRVIYVFAMGAGCYALYIEKQFVLHDAGYI